MKQTAAPRPYLVTLISSPVSRHLYLVTRPSSLSWYSRRFADFRPFLGLAAQERGVLLRALAAQLVALSRVQVARFGALQLLRQHFVHARNDRLRRRGRSQDAVP